MDDPATTWRQTLRERLMAARKSRDATRVSVLRSALSAIDNAETPDSETLEVATSGPVAGSVAGLGAADVPRRVLTDSAIRELLRLEVDERLTAAERISAGGYPDRAVALRAEAAVLVDLLGGV
jgi:uncharacterized protein